jgi:hypothetical protein
VVGQAMQSGISHVGRKRAKLCEHRWDGSATPMRGKPFLRVAEKRQPWAGGLNPFGIPGYAQSQRRSLAILGSDGESKAHRHVLRQRRLRR